MALGNFIETVWSAKILQALRKSHVFASTANLEYQGTLKNLGDKVKVMQISDITVAAYTKSTTVTPTELDDAASELIADQAYYFAFKASDLEAVQQKPAVLAQSTGQAAYGFRDTVDSYFAGLYATSGMTSYATGTTNWDITSLNVEDAMLDVAETMDDGNCPREGRFMVIPPWFHTKLILAGLATKTQNDTVFANGLVDRVLGFDLLLSPNVSIGTAATGANTRILAGVRGQSFAFAEAILKVEAYRMETGFHDAVKGLYVFGGKVFRPDMTCTLYCDKTAEA